MGAKEEALKERRVSDKVMFTQNFSKYSFCENYEDLMRIIKKQKVPRICEYVFEALPVNFFYDIDIKETANTKEFKNYKEIVQDIIDKTTSFFNDRGIVVRVIVLKSHTSKKSVEQKKSFHIIFRSEKQVFSIPCCISITNFIFADSEYMKKGIIDKSVFREGNFRSYLCSKKDEVRPFLRCKSFGSQEFEDVDTFVQYYSTTAIILTEKDLHIPVNHERVLGKVLKDKGKVGEVEGKKGKAKKVQVKSAQKILPSDILPESVNEIVRSHIKKHYHCPLEYFQTVKLEEDHILIGSLWNYCPYKKDDHGSNHQYFLIFDHESYQKCHKDTCKTKKHNIISYNLFSPELKKVVKDYLNRDKKSESIRKLIQDSQKEGIDYVQTYDRGVTEMTFNEDQQVFTAPATDECQVVLRGGCAQCRIEHRIEGSNYCMKCLDCNLTFPSSGGSILTIDPNRAPSLANFSTNYNQIVNNVVTIHNTTIVTGGEEDFSCDINLSTTCNLGDLTPLYNQILDGHKTAKISELLFKMGVDFVYAVGNYYHFNGTIWKLDKEQLKLKKSIMDLTKNFGQIKSHYESLSVTETNAAIIKNLKSLITKLNKPSLKADIITEAKMYFDDENFYRLLNSKKHLVPFTNGVFDLVKRQFRKTEKNDYINLTMGFEYNNQVKNPEVWDFLCKILPDQKVRDYVLKKMSECLNGDIPNTHFVMFIGEGANGKSQILNLMKATMGEFGEKIEVTLLTRKRNNANEANPEKIKLVNKRFGFLSEPEDGEKLNIGLLKELTGSEEIVSRGLYEGSYTFVMETKLFLACNQLPDINNNDENAIWRRIRVVDFPSRFVDDPVAGNEYLIDRTLPARMREDVTWRQTFVNILLDYHYKVIAEPEAVRLRTNQYKEETNEIAQWVDQNIIYEVGSYLLQSDLNNRFFTNPRTSNKEKGRFKVNVENVLEKYKVTHPGFQNLSKLDRFTNTNKQDRGWRDIKLI